MSINAQRRRAAHATLLAEYDEYEYDGYDHFDDDFDNYDYDCHDDTRYDQDYSSDGSRSPPGRAAASIQVDLMSLHRAKKEREEAEDTKRQNHKRIARKTNPSSKQTTINTKAASNNDGALSRMSIVPTPHMVRSASGCFSPHKINHSDSITDNKDGISTVNIAGRDPFETSSPGTIRVTSPRSVLHCLQNLLPASVRPSALGPTPHASLIVTSTTYRAAVALVWSAFDVKAVPVAGCDWDTVARLTDAVRNHVDVIRANSGLDEHTRYYKMSWLIDQKLNEWIAVLESELEGCLESKGKKPRFFHTVFQKSGLFTGDCLDSFDLFQEHVQDSVQETGMSKQQPTTGINSNSVNNVGAAPSLPFDQVSHPIDERLCLVCFDTVDDDDRMSEVAACGHTTCSDCWKRYFVAAASSGESSIICTADKCNHRLGLLEAAQLFFLDNHTDDTNGTQDCDRGRFRVTFEKLVKYELERLVPKLDKARFCSSPSCGQVLVPSAVNGSIGRSLLVCQKCGDCRCADCPNNGPAHPGMSCQAFQNMRAEIESGKVDNELAK